MKFAIEKRDKAVAFLRNLVMQQKEINPEVAAEAEPLVKRARSSKRNLVFQDFLDSDEKPEVQDSDELDQYLACTCAGNSNFKRKDFNLSLHFKLLSREQG